MDWTGGLFMVAASLLLVSGAAKLRAPEATQGALRASRLPAPAWAVRTLGITELAIGTLGLLTGARAPAAVTAVAYASFATYVAVARRRGGANAPCGCFGQQDAPPGVVHLVVTLALAAVAVLQAATVSGSRVGLPAVLGHTPLEGAALAGYVAVCTWLLYLVLSVLPQARKASSQG